MMKGKRKVISELLKRGFFVTPDFLEQIDENFDVQSFLNELDKEFVGSPPKILSSEVLLKIKKKKEKGKEIFKIEKIRKTTISVKKGQNTLLSFFGTQKSKNVEDKKVEKRIKIVEKISYEREIKIEEKNVEILEKKDRRLSEEVELSVRIIENYTRPAVKASPSVWASYFSTRLSILSKYLKRNGFAPVSIDYIKNKNNEVDVVGLVWDISKTPNGNLKIILEDKTGKITAIVRKEDKELYDLATGIALDSVIGLRGTVKNQTLFVSELFYPDIPFKQRKTYQEDVYILFTGDMQIGSSSFLKKNWEKFLRWLKGEEGNKKQRELAKKVGYIVIVGDLVDGIGIYPGQENELEIKDIYKQYEVFQKYMEEIPEGVKVIIIPGNHDVVVRLAEPQPPLPKEFLQDIYGKDKFILLSNPSVVNLHKREDFEGIDVLIYHGYSFDRIISDIEYVRNKGGYDNPPAIMKYLLQLRHLGPMHSRHVYIPYPDDDPLIIKTVPDVFVSGHIHRAAFGNYKGVDLINASCWQGPTPYQIEMGHKPDPCKVFLKSIKTGKVSVLSFA